MDHFVMEIAGAPIAVESIFLSTKEYCRPYLTDRKAEHFVQVSRLDLEHEQLLLEQEAVEQGIKPRKFPDPFLERAVILRQVSDYLLDRNTLMLHGSAVSVDGKAYLFTAPCGTGKSTHTRLWREVFGDRAVMVNDDKPFLQLTPNGVLTYGSPWSGKHGIANNICVSLAGICSLHRGPENSIRQAAPHELLEILRQQVHMPEAPSRVQKTLSLVDRLSEMVPLWVMNCNQDLEAAKVAYGAMSCDDICQG